MEGDHIKINKWLIPFSWLYGLGVGLRNELFELNILKTRRFGIPVISVGNITVGGSGKTPHVEYLIRLLKDKMKVLYFPVDINVKVVAMFWLTRTHPCVRLETNLIR